MAVNSKQRPGHSLFGATSGKVHLNPGEAEFPHYDFWGRDQPGKQQHEQVRSALEGCHDGWRRRLEAMLYRSELSLSSRVCDSVPVMQGPLYFVMEHQWDGLLQPSAVLYIEHATLYRLAEMTFGGLPSTETGRLRALSETERRLGASLLAMLTDALVARILPEAVPGCARLLAAAPDLEVDTLVSFDIGFAGQTLSWALALPLLQVAAGEALPTPAERDLSQALNACLPKLSTRLSIPLATFELSLGQVAELREGDVLPVTLLQEVVARAGEQPVLKGRVAERDGMLVFASHGFID